VLINYGLTAIFSPFRAERVRDILSGGFTYGYSYLAVSRQVLYYKSYFSRAGYTRGWRPGTASEHFGRENKKVVCSPERLLSGVG